MSSPPELLPVPDPGQVPLQALEDAADSPWARTAKGFADLFGQILEAAGREFFFVIIVDPHAVIPQYNQPTPSTND